MVSLLYLFSDLLPIFLVQVNLFDQIRDFFGPEFLAHGLKTGSLFLEIENDSTLKIRFYGHGLKTGVIGYSFLKLAALNEVHYIDLKNR